MTDWWVMPFAVAPDPWTPVDWTLLWFEDVAAVTPRLLPWGGSVVW